MPILTQGIQTGEFLLSEATGERSREQVTVTVAGAVALPSGTVLGKITATGKYIKYLDGASDGSQTAAAVLLNACPGVNGDYKCAVFVRDCEVVGAMLNGGANVDAPGKVDLTAIGVIVR
jgi:hypothetical protein